jgi:hypothetical protein
MKGEKERIDRLLDKNAAEQLARINWDRLTDEISARLDRARQIEFSPVRWPSYFKMAGGIAAAAAVILSIVMWRTQGPTDVHVPEGRSAVVEFADQQGRASVRLNDPAGKTLVVIHAGRDDRKVATCVVDIIDRKNDLEREHDRAAWIIISKPQRTIADNGQSKEETDILCLL